MANRAIRFVGGKIDGTASSGERPLPGIGSGPLVQVLVCVLEGVDPGEHRPRRGVVRLRLRTAALVAGTGREMGSRREHHDLVRTDRAHPQALRSRGGFPRAWSSACRAITPAEMDAMAATTLPAISSWTAKMSAGVR